MFENIIKFFKKSNKKEALSTSSRDTAKERLHLVLMQDRANVSADFLDLMRQEIIEVIKKYIDIDESALDVRLKNQANEDGTQGAPVLYANIPILNIKDENKILKKNAEKQEIEETTKGEEKKEQKSEKNERLEAITEEKIKELENNQQAKKEKNERDEQNEQEPVENNKDNEEKQQEANIDEEIEKQEEEKIEEAKKIVQEENSDIGDSETDNKQGWRIRICKLINKQF